MDAMNGANVNERKSLNVRSLNDHIMNAMNGANVNERKSLNVRSYDGLI